MDTKDANIAAEAEKWAEDIGANAIRDLTDDEIGKISGGVLSIEL